MTPIVYGKKERRKHLGRRAGFCEICRKPRILELYQFSSYSHFYWIPTSSYQSVSTVEYCTTCHTSFAIQSAPTIEAKPRIITPPHPSELVSEVEEHDQAAYQSRERLHAISRPFQLLAPRVENLYATNNREARKPGPLELLGAFSPIHVIKTGPPTGSLCRAASIVLLMTIFLPIGLLFAGLALAKTGQPAPWWSYTGAILSLAVGSVSVPIVQASFRQRTLAMQILPLLAQALKPLEPTVTELRLVLSAFSSLGYRIGNTFTPEQLADMIKAQS